MHGSVSANLPFCGTVPPVDGSLPPGTGVGIGVRFERIRRRPPQTAGPSMQRSPPTKCPQNPCSCLPKPRYWKAFELIRSEEHTTELQSRENLVCRLL